MSGVRTEESSRAERRLIRIFERRGGKGFRVLRSAERPLRQFKRTQPRTPAGSTEETPS